MGEGVVWREAPSSLWVWNVFRQIISLGVFLKSVNNVLNKYNLEKMALSLTDDFDVVKNVLDECGQISVTRFMKVSFGSIFFAQVNHSVQRKGLKRFCISQLMISVLIRLWIL